MKFSREGKRFVLATALIAVAALNTGNNLIYLILSMMLSILVLSVFLVKLNLKGLEIKLFQSQPVFAKSPASIEIALSNRKRIIPSYSIRVLMPEWIRGGANFSGISGSTEISKSVSVIYARRGVYKYGDFSVESGFPFIFLSDRVLCRVSGEVIVYPEMRKTDDTIPEIIGRGYDLSLTRIGRGDEFSLIREFRYGDDWRRIHWKASAKTAKVMVMEYAAQEPRKLTIVLDNLAPFDVETFEKAVSFAGSVAERFLDEGFFVRLLTCKKMIPFGSGREQLYKILDVLAVIDGKNSWEHPLSDKPEGPTILILSSERSHLNRYISLSDMVVNASNL